MTAPTVEQYITAQSILTAALAFVFAVAAWGVKRFITVVDNLVSDYATLHERVAAIEIRLGLMTDKRTPQGT